MSLMASAVLSKVGDSKREGIESFAAACVTPVLGGKRVETLLTPLCHWHSAPWTPGGVEQFVCMSWDMVHGYES